MLTIQQCRKALGLNEKEISDEQILAIRDFLSTMAEVYVQNLKEIQDEKNSRDLHQGINGYAS